MKIITHINSSGSSSTTTTTTTSSSILGKHLLLPTGIWKVIQILIHRIGRDETVMSIIIIIIIIIIIGQDSVVGIANRYGLDGPAIESRLGREFHTRPGCPWGLLSFLCNGYRIFPGG